jgi:hypothetical protein
MAGGGLVAAYRDRPGVSVRFYVGLAYALWLAAILALLGIVLWRLWTEVLHAWPV